MPYARPRSRLAALGVALALFVAGCGESEPPTWSDEVAGIVYGNCSGCHRPEGPGPMPLLSYDDARPYASLMADVTSEGTMPPWLPARDAGIHFQDERTLTDPEIRALRRWADAGAPRGDPADEPAAPEQATGWALGEPDLVLEMDESFPVPAAGDHDFFRNFVLDVPVQEPRWVRAVELRPDNPAVLHHATMRVDPTRSSRLAADVDSLPGFDALVVESAASPPSGFFVGWTPGLVPAPFPDGTAFRLDPGSDMVVNAHLWPSGRPEEIRLRIGLHFADEPPTREPAILRLGAQTINIPPGEANYEVTDAFRIPVAIRAIGSYPHAHFLARRMEVWAERPDGRRVPLMDIPEWDFDWQGAYYYREPIDLPAGTILRMRYTYDNSAGNPRNPFDPPRRILWGLNSSDEMAEFWLQVVTERPGELEELRRVAGRRDLQKQVEGWEHLAELDPDNPDVHLGLGDVARGRGDLDAALGHYDRALEARPEMTMAHHGRGLVLEELGDRAAAARAFEDALGALPTNLAALTDLGRLRHAEGRSAEARQLLDRAVALDSTFATALTSLGGLFLDEGDAAAAEAPLRRAVRYAPDLPEAQFNLALALVRVGRGEEGLEALARGLELDGSRLQPALAVAWTLATHPDDAVRRPLLAADLAVQIREAAGPGPVVSDVAAAALAAAGSFAQAVRLVDEAIAAAGSDAPERLAELRERRALYRAERAYVQPGGG